ncbi:MAG: phosphoenolpyruvate carboxykinase, partial [Allosphingosinicella sp.]
ITEDAWHSLFARTMFLKPRGLDAYRKHVPEFTVICAPGFGASPIIDSTRTETFIVANFAERIAIIGGSSYAGEIKKTIFTVLNFLLPLDGVMSMHCSANVGPEGSALFFGLSGTGKTTLSADPSRQLIGDDEHGWSDNGVFNIEDGCYAKVIRLSPEAEPQIYACTRRFGTVLENVVIDPVTRELDFDDSSLAENSRGAYPIEYIPNSSDENMGPVPKNVIFLTADAFGVLPPVAKLTPDQAMYHFLSGYTAKVAGTEIGVTEPEATFSTCFGAPFMPRHPSVYGNLLKARIAKGGVSCWLVNTGWTGGKYGVGERMPIKATRALLNAALDGSLNDVTFRTDENFGFEVPVSVPGVDTAILNPRDTWADKGDYDATAAKLVKLFIDNFAKFEAHVDAGVRDAAPRAQQPVQTEPTQTAA